MTLNQAMRRTLTIGLIIVASGGATWAQVPGGCETPAVKGKEAVGCYLSATEVLGVLPAGQMFWHLDQYPTRSAAEAMKGPRSTVVEAFQKFWLYTIAEPEWRPAGGTRIATIGPLPTHPGRPYTARYMEAVFTQGIKGGSHTHSGPEAWFVVSGDQCLETPDKVLVAKAGEGSVVAEGLTMAISSVGAETRRSVAIVLHDSTQPWMTVATSWEPSGKCPQ
jgi:hypothetical protein